MMPGCIRWTNPLARFPRVVTISCKKIDWRWSPTGSPSEFSSQLFVAVVSCLLFAVSTRAKMRQKSGPGKAPAEQVLKDIRRQTRRQYSAEEKIRIVLEGLRGEENISELCRREGIAASMYYGWSKEFLEAGKRRLAGDTARAATPGEVKDLRREASVLKEVVADLTLENRLLKKSMSGTGDDEA